MKTACLIIVIFVSSVLISCSSDGARKQDLAAERYKTLSMQKYGSGVEWIPNSAGTAILCVKRMKPTAQVPQHQVSFFIFDIAADRVVFDDDIPNGSVRWKDDQSVIVETVPGIEKKDEASPPPRRGYIVDIRTGKAKDLGSVIVQ